MSSHHTSCNLFVGCSICFKELDLKVDMYSLIRFFARFHFVILFFVLELIAFSLVVKHHKNGSQFLHSANTVMGNFYGGVNSIVGYYNLKAENESLVSQNATLLNRNLVKVIVASDSAFADTTLRYRFIGATVIKNTTHKLRNFITLNKGEKSGIKPDMAVVSPKGAVGIVIGTSDHFSLVISALNVDGGVSAKIKRNNQFGSLVWKGSTPEYAVLNGISSHTEVQKGDTVITSGFSSSFPEGELVGIVAGINEQPGTNFFTIKVRLSVNFNEINQVYVIENKFKKEQEELEGVIE